MFYHNSVRLKESKEKLSKKLNKEQERINQPISVRELFVYCDIPKEYYKKPYETLSTNLPQQLQERLYGEYLFVGAYEEKDHHLVRLLFHIQSFAKIANEFHKQFYCNKNEDGTFTIKEDCLNKLTYLYLHEYFLYTSEPIKMHEFSVFFETILAIPDLRQANVRLLLSSIPVLTESGEILNMSLSVQGGENPKIYPFCKSGEAEREINYDLSAFSQIKQHVNIDYSQYISQPPNQGVIPCDTLFVRETEGGAKYIEVFDTCADHLDGHSKHLVESMAKANASVGMPIIPNQVNHVLTSNTLRKVESSAVSEHVVHIDSVNDMPEHVMTTITESNLSNALQEIQEKYTEMSIKEAENGFIVENAPFGANYRIVVTNERKLSGFAADLKPMIEKRNEAAKKHFINSHLHQTATPSVFSPKGRVKDLINTFEQISLRNK